MLCPIRACMLSGTNEPPTGCIPLKDPTIAKLAAKYKKNSGQFMLK